MRGDSGISLTGLHVCGTIAFVMLVLKLSVIDTWSWWRVLLPLGLFVGFNVANIVVAFIYLSIANIPQRPDGDEADVLEPHTINVHYVAAMLFFVAGRDFERTGAKLAIELNIIWVIVSYAGLIFGWFSVNLAGKWAIALIAEAVMIFAIIEFIALRRTTKEVVG